MRTINNTHEDKIRNRISISIKYLIGIAIICGGIYHLLTRSVLEETKQQQQIDEMRVTHSDKGLVEENKYLGVLITRK